MDMRSSVLAALLLAPLMLVSGVFAPFTEVAGVDVDVEGSVPPAAFFAAFSASLFCFDAEGAMAVYSLQN